MRPIDVSQRRRFSSKKAGQVSASDASNRVPSEFLRELQTAASMIMSREECEAVAKEFAHLRRPRIVAA